MYGHNVRGPIMALKDEDATVSFGGSSFAATSFTCSIGTSLVACRGDSLQFEQLLDKKLAEHLASHAEKTDAVLRCVEHIAGMVETLTEPQRDRPTYSPGRPTSPKEPRPALKKHRPAASIQSLVELESAFLQEVCDVRSEHRRSVHVPVPEFPVVQVVPAVPDKGDNLPMPPDNALPGLLNSDADEADVQPKGLTQKRGRFQSAGSNLIILNQDTQACILDSHTNTHLSFEEPV